MRTALIGISHFGLKQDAAVLVVLSIAVLWAGSRLFARIEV
jgi:hypothetical protein